MRLSVLFFCLLCCTKAVLCTPTNFFSSSSFLKDTQTIVSKNNAFCLGFFSPSNSSHRYVGIWYNVVSSEINVIWVANREVPLNDRSGRLQISESGNKLIILNGQNNVIWSSALLSKNVSTAQILDSGNLVLLSKSGDKMWQSFDHPTDSVLPNMEVTARNVSGKISPVLTSWKSPSDPSIGRFSVSTDSLSLPQLVTWDGDRPHWRSGPWSGNIFIGIQYNEDYTYTGWRLTYNGQDSVSMMYSYPNVNILSFYGLNSQGSSSQSLWDSNAKRWVVLWHSPETDCSVYGTCGEFGIGTCALPNSPMCICLTGFVPKKKLEWEKGNWTNGCVRKTPLQCPNDGFFKLETVKVPDHANLSLGYVEDQCKEVCLTDCSCLAYSYYSGIGCMLWNRSLIDIVYFKAGGANLFLRLANSDLGQDLSAGKGKNKNMKIIIGAAGAATVTIVAIFVCAILKWSARHKGIKTLFGITEDDQTFEKFEELPLFKFAEIAGATNNFQESNKLGQGGFGAVYKGVLEDGGEIAVKRLSKTSRQGVQEFMNEVLVMSKLQHRNLVKLLGCCVESQERMLIYEYLPNKSLDAFLFDPLKNGTLDWKKRSSIIEGICRGLLYLHRDSRLKIIHRDLKAANILLDENLNPKISDFGMARIFGGDQSQADTTRVVGTYGYMPPEYAIEGRFSEKSDVFSFGVLMLEMITGKKTLWYDEKSLSLLGYVWKLWSEDNVGPLIDPVISDEAFQADILKCIHVALLCVQEYAEDRPDISIVISMLTTASTTSFRQPKAPGFTRLSRAPADTSTQNYHKGSNGLTITSVSGR